MASRSTRTKIRFQIDKACKALDESVEHLAKADVLADAKHPLIIEKMPDLVVMLDGCRQVLEQFRSEL